MELPRLKLIVLHNSGLQKAGGTGRWETARRESRSGPPLGACSERHRARRLGTGGTSRCARGQNKKSQPFSL